MFLSFGNACIANYRRFSSECSNTGRGTRVPTQWGGEGLVSHKQRAAKHQRSTWKPTALPRPLVSLHSHTLPSRNAESRTQTLDQAKGMFAAGVRGEKEATESMMWVDDVRKRLGEEEEESRGDGGRGLPQHYKHQTWQWKEQWSSEPNKTSPNLNQTLSHDNSQLYSVTLDTLCIHTAKINTGFRERDSQKQQSLRLKSTKSWDSLNKSYCWQQAAPCVFVCTRVHTRMSNVCWTHFHSERKCWQKAFILLFKIHTLHHSRGKVHVP